MGTRSLTHVYDDDGKTILLTMYRQMDGYPSGLGQELVDFLFGKRSKNGTYKNPMVVVNGFGSGTPKKAANGMGCLAALLVSRLKGDQIGSVYIYPPGSTDCGEEYVYSIRLGDPVVGKTGHATGNTVKVTFHSTYKVDREVEQSLPEYLAAEALANKE